MNTTNSSSSPFSKYHVFVIAVLAFTQFTVILDFMILSPMGPILLKDLNINSSQFSLVVSAYAFSAFASGLLAAGFADKFDRKKMLLFFYAGFVVGTIFCAIAPTYHYLLMARIVAGLFGGVINSLSFAIITDLFKMEVRGRVMGIVQMAFAASQALGIPAGLWASSHYGWHLPFWAIAIASAVVGLVMLVFMKPVNEHLKIKSERNAFVHLLKTLSNPDYKIGFLATTLLATGGFMLMPLGTVFSTHNLGIAVTDLPLLTGITGLSSIVFGPIIGKLCDKVGKYKVFFAGSIISIITVAIYTHMGITPLWLVLVLNVVLFIGISSRIISSSTMMSALPKPQDRGAFMSINSSIQQISGGLAAALAGRIVIEMPDGTLDRYNVLGYIVVCSALITIYLFFLLNKKINSIAANDALK